MGYKYDIPFNSITDNNNYQNYYYHLTKNNSVKYKKAREYIKSGNYPKPIKQEYIKPTYDIEGITKETETHIFYIDKVWSKTRDRYLKCTYIKRYKSDVIKIPIKSYEYKLIILSGELSNINTVI